MLKVRVSGNGVRLTMKQLFPPRVSDYQCVNMLYVSAFVLRNLGEVPFGFRCQEFSVSDNSQWGAKFAVGAVSAWRLEVGS